MLAYVTPALVRWAVLASLVVPAEQRRPAQPGCLMHHHPPKGCARTYNQCNQRRTVPTILGSEHKR